MRRFDVVEFAINVVGRDDRHYTMMMLRDGQVVMRRHGNQGNRVRMNVKSFVYPDDRSEETLRYIAELKGFAVL